MGRAFVSRGRRLARPVDQEAERHRMTLEALDDVDAGRVTEHQAVQAWAASLGTDKPGE